MICRRMHFVTNLLKIMLAFLVHFRYSRNVEMELIAHLIVIETLRRTIGIKEWTPCNSAILMMREENM